MSRETLEHLNTDTPIGNTDARGTAWHYRAEEQCEETNHYPGPIPVADVESDGSSAGRLSPGGSPSRSRPASRR